MRWAGSVVRTVTSSRIIRTPDSNSLTSGSAATRPARTTRLRSMTLPFMEVRDMFNVRVTCDTFGNVSRPNRTACPGSYLMAAISASSSSYPGKEGSAVIIASESVRARSLSPSAAAVRAAT